MSLQTNSIEHLSAGPSLPTHDCLPKITRDRLRKYHHRRMQLTFWRRLGWLALVSVLALLTACCLDALIAQELARWSGSIAFYLLFGLGLGFYCLLPLFKQIELRGEAARIESQEPQLKQQLLAAVELSQQDMRGDSPAFREQLQQQVARRMATLDVRELLPSQSAFRMLLAGGLAMLILLLLCQIPGLQLAQRMTRILLPAANLARVTRNAIKLEQPQPHSGPVPVDEMVAVVANITGPPPNMVQLESRGPWPALKQKMDAMASPTASTASTLGEPWVFAGVLTATAPWQEYRVTADGAQTPWYRLTTSPRPRVARFHKRLQPAEYTQRPSVILSEEHGDLAVMRGTRVHLDIEFNVPISQARLEWMDGRAADLGLNVNLADDCTPLPLATAADRASIEFTVERTAAYRLHVVAAGTGFNNAFSPTFQIVCAEDLPPALRWIQPRSESLVVQREAIVDLELEIHDELPLQSLTQRLHVLGLDGSEDTQDAQTNDSQAWTATPLTAADEQGRVAWELDLLPLELAAGDRLALDVTAVDLYGNRTQSSTLEVLIAVAQTELAESNSDRWRQEISSDLEGLAAALTTSRDETRQVKQPLDKKQESSLAKLHTANIQRVSQQLTAELRSRSPALLTKIEAALAETQDAVGEIELRATAGLLSKLHNESAVVLQEKAQALFEAVETANVEIQTEQIRAVTQIADQSLNEISELASDFRVMVSHDVVSRHVRQLTQLAVAQQQLQNAIDLGQISPQRLRRQYMVLARQMRDAQTELRQSIGVRADTKKRFQEVADEMNWLIEQADRLQDDRSEEAVRQLTSSLTNSLQKLQTMQHLDGGLAATMRDSRRRTEEHSGAAQAPLHRLAQDLQQKSIGAGRFKSVIEQLSVHRAMTKTGEYANHQFSADLGNARRALVSVARNSNAAGSDQALQVKSIADAVSILSATNAVHQSATLLANLAQTENWALELPESRIEQPRTWDTFSSSLERAVSQVREAHLPNEIVSQLDRIRWSAVNQTAARKIQARLGQPGKVISAAAELEQLAVALLQVNNMLQSHAEQARGQLRQVTPSISELAQQAAQATQKLQQQTQKLAQDVQRSQAPDPGARLESLEQDLARLSQPIGELRDALVDQAAAQNVLDHRELQVARHADAAIDIVERADQQMAQSLDNVDHEISTQPNRQHQALSAAAEMQADAARAFEQLAQQFERLQSLSDEQITSDAAAQLADMSRIGDSLSGEPESRAEANDYDQAELLAAMNRTSPEETLRELEQELARNQPMQQAMSEIARNAAHRALDELEHAADQQAKLKPSLEASDPQVQAKKELLAHDLQHVRRFTQDMLDSLVREARSTAGSGQQAAQEQRLSELEDQLREVQQSADLAQETATIEEMLQGAMVFNEALSRAGAELERESKTLADVQQTAIHKNDAELNNRRREMGDLLRRVQQQDVRHAQQFENQQRQALNRAESAVRQAQQRSHADEQRLQQAQKQADKKDEQPALQERVAQQQQRLAITRAQQTAREQFRDSVKQRAVAAKALLEQVNQAQPEEFESLNPSAQLSSLLAEKAARRSADLARALADWSQDPPEIQASQAQLQSASDRQQDIGQAVNSAASDLVRAARHEA